MADYYSPTVVQPSISLLDITPIELLLLTSVFESAPTADIVYLFASVHIDDTPVLAIDEVRTALAEGPDCRTAVLIRERLAACAENDAYLQLEEEALWEAALQDIVQRSATLDHVEIISSYTCSKMRPDGFGGAVTIITADRILFSSTHDMACELLDRAQYGELGCAPGHGCHVLLRLAEENVRSMLDDVFEAEVPPHPAIEDVTNADIREACFAVRANSDLSHEEGEANFRAAMQAMRIAGARRGGAD